MKTLSAVAFLLLVSIGVSLSLPAITSGGQNNRSSNRPRPLPPRNSNGPRKVDEPTGPITCPGLSDCKVAKKDLPVDLPVAFPGPDGMTLHGHLFVPGVRTLAELDALSKAPRNRVSDPNASAAGTGGLRSLGHIFPSMIYNHGSTLNPDGEPTLAKLYVDSGYIFFAPDRHGQGTSKDAGPYHVTEQQKLDKRDSGYGKAVVALHEKYNRDVIAAVEWFKKQPYVDPNRILMTGLSFGGIQTVMAAEKDPGIRAYIPFAPAAMSWGLPALDRKLKNIVTNVRAPMFIIQATGDYSLGPVEELGQKLAEKGDPSKWRSKLYPQFGCTNDQAHRRFAQECDGIAIWSHDVLEFIDQILKSPG